MLSEHFNENEFRCHHCGALPADGMSEDLLELLENIRHAAGDVPVAIMSGYRCPEHNKAVGGAKSSQHMLGTAADIKIEGKTPKKVAEIAARFLAHSGGIGIYPTFTHVDVRRNRARW